MSHDLPELPVCVHLGYLEDAAIITYIRRANSRLRFIGPGCSKNVADALAESWRKLGPNAVQVVLDADAELCRLGFGDGDAIKLLVEVAGDIGGSILWQPGARLCVLEVDGERIIFPPTPRLVEAASASSSEILLSPKNEQTAEDQILSPRDKPLRALTQRGVDEVCEDLKHTPPQPFDLARQVRVVSTQFQFVEFALENAALTRRRAKIPPELLGLTNGDDEATKDLLHASFQLIAKGDEVSGEELSKRRHDIAETYLTPISDYGSIILRENSEDFWKEVGELRAQVTKFQTEAKAKLAEAIERNCQTVTDQLLPFVQRKPPKAWTATMGPHATDKQRRDKLSTVLRAAFGNANAHLTKMRVKVVVKNVTVDMLNDEEFRTQALKKGLDITSKYEEYEAARARSTSSGTTPHG